MKKAACIALVGILITFSCQSISDRTDGDVRFIGLPKSYAIQVIDSSVEKEGKKYVKIKIKGEQFLISLSFFRDITMSLGKCSVNLGISIKTGEVHSWREKDCV